MLVYRGPELNASHMIAFKVCSTRGDGSHFPSMKKLNSLGVQWLGLHAFTAGGTGLIPGQGTEILQAMQYSLHTPKIKEWKFRDINLPQVFFFFFSIYLFIWLCLVLVVACGISLAVVHRLSCPVACRILVARPGIELASPALQGEFLTTGPPGESLPQVLKLRRI